MHKYTHLFWNEEKAIIWEIFKYFTKLSDWFCFQTLCVCVFVCVWLLILRLPGGHRNSVLAVNTNRRKWAGAWRAPLCLFHPDQQTSPCREKSARPETAVIGPNVSFTETRQWEIRTKCQSRSNPGWESAVETDNLHTCQVIYSSKAWMHLLFCEFSYFTHFSKDIKTTSLLLLRAKVPVQNSFPHLVSRYDLGPSFNLQ